jgi:LysM repeat protein
LLVVAIPFSVHAGLFSDIFAQATTTPAAEAVHMDSPSDVSLLSALKNPDPQGGKVATDVVVDENALVSSGPISEDEMAAQNSSSDEISVYTVRPGDSLSQIAKMFGVTSNTILWANNLKKKTDIAPGQSLVILPIAGVRHVVKNGDTIQTIAKKYDGNVDDILAFNQLDSASDVKVGDTIIVPGGEVRAVEPPKKEVTPTKKKTTATDKKTKGDKTVASTGTGGLINPAPGSIKTQGIHGHNGVDLGGAMGSTIRAAAAGQVIIAKFDGGWNGGYGNYIVIKHNNGTQTLYGHLSNVIVDVGQAVDQGQTIGAMGNTGKSTGTHLHFEVRGGRNPF